jgi:hypothetical protein
MVLMTLFATKCQTILLAALNVSRHGSRCANKNARQYLLSTPTSLFLVSLDIIGFVQDLLSYCFLEIKVAHSEVVVSLSSPLVLRFSDASFH